MITLGEVPKGLLAIIDAYGNPDSNGDFLLDTSWVDNHLAVYDLPFPMRLAWNKLTIARRIQVHRSVGPVMIDALRAIQHYKGWEYLIEQEYDLYGGCFNFRAKRLGGELSTHSWGIAIDINPHIAPMGSMGHQPQFIIDAFVERGFVWGGTFPVPDGMHFQACRGH